MALGTRTEIAETYQYRHPGTVQIMEHFAYLHLPEPLQVISAPVGVLAARMVDALTDGPELTAGLRKLLEAKDCFVRAALARPSLAQPDGGLNRPSTGALPEVLEYRNEAR